MAKINKTESVNVPVWLQKIVVITALAYIIGATAYPLYELLRYAISPLSYGPFMLLQLLPLLFFLIPYLVANKNKKQLNRLFIATVFALTGWMILNCFYSFGMPLLFWVVSAVSGSDWFSGTLAPFIGSTIIVIIYTVLVIKYRKKINSI